MPPVLVALLLLAASLHLGGRRGPAPGSCHARNQGGYVLPDPACTPGATDPRVEQANIEQTICASGWTRLVRPPVSVTEPQKRAAMRAYGERGPLRLYEYDHLIPLALGGAPDDLHNLWPEPRRAAEVKDRLEERVHELVCAGRLSLPTAQQAIATSWITALRRYVG